MREEGGLWGCRAFGKGDHEGLRSVSYSEGSTLSSCSLGAAEWTAMGEPQVHTHTVAVCHISS